MMENDVLIRRATSDDFNDVMQIETLAFGSAKEAEWVAEVIAAENTEPYLSLLAFYRGEAVGHILFTPGVAEGSADTSSIYILAPLAIKPAYQKQGLGGLLIEAGLRYLRESGVKLVLVLGHKEYYPRHGFKGDAESAGFFPPYPLPREYADYWMYQYLTPDTDNIPKGRIRCTTALDKPQHWRE